MSSMIEQSQAVWPLLVFGLGVLGVIGAMLGLAWVTGNRHQDRLTGTPYESGMIPIGSTHMRFSVKFYLVAIFFVLFDLEVVFVIAWALVARQVGWTGYIEAVIFVGVLTLGLVYIWRIGALDWAPKRHLPDTRKPTNEARPTNG